MKYEFLMRYVLGFRDFIKFKRSKHIIHTIVQLKLWLNYSADGDLCGLVKYNSVQTNYKWLCLPVHISGSCSQYLYNNFHLSSQISNVTLVDGGQSVKFSTEVIFSPEKYEIV